MSESRKSRNVYLEDIPLEEALGRIEMALNQAGKSGSLPGEAMPLNEAVGRITAEPVWAKLSSPHYHAAAMDGYAVRARDTFGATDTRPLRLKLNEEAFPVNTGNPLPPDTNAVIKIEDVQHIEEEAIEIRASVAPWGHVRMMGEDMVATELILPADHRLRPVDLGAMAGCGYHSAIVRRKPEVILIPTGDELVAPGQTPKPGQIIEYNGLVLQAQIIEAGGRAVVTDAVPDDPEKMVAALRAAAGKKPDLILILSGSSAGSTDYTAGVVRECGKLLLHGVAVRPGHPVIAGMVENTLVFGVPGYPVSAALTGEIFILPQIRRWLGMAPQIDQRPRLKATMTRKLLSPTGDDDFVRVALAEVGGRMLAAPLGRGAGAITSLVRADALAHIPRFSEGLDMGQEVEVILYRTVDSIRRTVMIMGSHDPMLDLLNQHFALRFPGWRLTSAHVGSMGGLVALRRGEAHLAGTHLLDETSGEYNISYVKQYVPDRPVRLVTFAHREQGLLVAPGNPLQIEGLDDLTRVSFVNRQRGSGTRVLLDYELEQNGIAAGEIEGYEREEYTHLSVAAAVASGTADCGLAVRSAAIALDLEFIPVGWERYDLAIPEEHLEHEGVRNLLTVLDDEEFREALAGQPGYDIRETGKVQ